MAKENGGIIGVVNTPTQSVASGVWASQDQYNARVGNIWPGGGGVVRRTFQLKLNYRKSYTVTVGCWWRS
jgi:hypothetical protein